MSGVRRALQRTQDKHLAPCSSPGEAVLDELALAGVPRGFLGASETHTGCQVRANAQMRQRSWDKGTGKQVSLRAPPADKILGRPRVCLKNSL